MNAVSKIPIRRTDTERTQVGSLFDGINRYYDQNMELTVVKLMTGENYVTDEEREMVVTILGEAVAVCLHDPVKNVGGIVNIHVTEDSMSEASQYLEKTLDKIINWGSRKENIEAKIFGGGSLENKTIESISFAKEFVEKHDIFLKNEDTGGNLPRRLHYFPDTGKAMVRKLRRKEDYVIFKKEKIYLGHEGN